MCRLAAYLGPSLSLKSFLLDPPHSLVKQSWAPREMSEAVLNADGFGIGWYTDPGQPATYLNTHPIWSDANLPSLARSLENTLWTACVRSATPGQLTGLNNTQPFTQDNLLFMHNGYIKDFRASCKIRFNEYLAPEYRSDINGNTDSEYIFAVFRQLLAQHAGDASLALKQTVADINTLVADVPALFNLTIADGDKLYALRHAINDQSPSLYYSENAESLGKGSVIASEPLTDSDEWHEFPEGHLLIVDRKQNCQWLPL